MPPLPLSVLLVLLTPLPVLPEPMLLTQPPSFVLPVPITLPHVLLPTLFQLLLLVPLVTLRVLPELHVLPVLVLRTLSVLLLQPPLLSVKLPPPVVLIVPQIMLPPLVTMDTSKPPQLVPPVPLTLRLVLMVLPVLPVTMVISWPVVLVLLSVPILLPPDVLEPNVVPLERDT